MKELLIILGGCGLVYGGISLIPIIQEVAATRSEDERARSLAAERAAENLEVHGNSFNSHVDQSR